MVEFLVKKNAKLKFQKDKAEFIYKCWMKRKNDRLLEENLIKRQRADLVKKNEENAKVERWFKSKESYKVWLKKKLKQEKINRSAGKSSNQSQMSNPVANSDCLDSSSINFTPGSIPKLDYT